MQGLDVRGQNSISSFLISMFIRGLLQGLLAIYLIFKAKINYMFGPWSTMDHICSLPANKLINFMMKRHVWEP